MHCYFIVILCVFSLCVNLGNCNRERVKEILDIVKRIEEHIAKEDRIREITDIIRIEQNVDRMNDKLDRVLSFLDETMPLPPPVGRSVSTAVQSQDLASSMEGIQSGLQSLELSVKSVEETMKKLDFDPVKVNEIERRTTQIKDDMNVKLRKTMNILSELYEMNKEMRSRALGLDDNGEPLTTPKRSESISSSASEFLVENLDEMERKIKEQFSILSSEMRSEVASLKLVASSAGANCPTTPRSEDEEEEEENWQTPRINARSGRIPPPGQSGRSSTNKDRTLDNLVESLGRSTREIRHEIQQGIQGIDTKLQNLTALASSRPSCDPLDTSESIVAPRRAIMPPEQSLRSAERRAKMDSCTKTVQNVPNPKSCADLRKGGATCDGIYVIFPKGRRAVRVQCDMTTQGGGWTILMRRGDYGDKMTSFNRNWLSYKNGFGDTEGEFWLGNDVLNYMTTEEPNFLRVHMSSFDGDQINLDYSSFSVGNESSSYRLHVGPPVAGQSTPAANSLTYHNGHPFSTFDRKNDNFEQNCAATYKGGWWFNGCYFGFLTGEYFRQGEKRENWQGILWYDWKGHVALKGAEMMVRPKNFEI